MSREVKQCMEDMQVYIGEQGWELKEAIFDYTDSWEGLFSLVDKLKTIQIIMIYSTSNIADDFSLDFLYETSRSEGVEVLEFVRSRKKI